MNKRILIISNPGEPGAQNYCQGVNIDVEKYIGFFKSPLGGAWKEQEIKHLNRPTALNVKREISDMSNLDYSLVIFGGHGWYSSVDRATVLELGNRERLNEMELRYRGEKRTIILDCCREVHDKSILKALHDSVAFASYMQPLSPFECRKLYEKSISEASSGLVVAHACHLNQTAGDSSRFGGYYSESLRQSAENWREGSRARSSVLSIVTAHEGACKNVASLSGGRQTPQIEKPRAAPYFPFAVIA